MKNSKKIHFICLCSQLTDMLYAYVKLEFTVFMIKKYYIQVYILKKTYITRYTRKYKILFCSCIDVKNAEIVVFCFLTALTSPFQTFNRTDFGFYTNKDISLEICKWNLNQNRTGGTTNNPKCSNYLFTLMTSNV